MKKIYNQYFAEDKKDILLKLLNALVNIAMRLKCTQLQLAMAWVLANTNISTAITSATRPEQLDGIVKSVQVVKLITPEVNKEIDEIQETSLCLEWMLKRLDLKKIQEDIQ